MSSKKVKIKDVAQLINGHPFKPEDRSEKGLKIIRIQNLNNPIATYNLTEKKVADKYRVKEGDILIAWSASLGVYEWDQDEALLNQHIFKVEFTSDKILKKFFKYIVQLAFDELSYKMRGVGLKHLTKKQLDEYEFDLPEINEQKKVVYLLNKTKNFIDKRKLIIDLLDEYLNSTFLDMFGDPVLNTKNWKTEELKNLLITNIDYRGKTPPKSNSGIPLISSANVRNGEVRFKPKQFISEEDYKIWTTRGFVNENDILITTEAPAGEVALYPNGKFLISRRIIALRPIEKLDNIFLYFLMRNKNWNSKIREKKIGATVERIRKENLLSQIIIQPNVELQQKFARIYNRVKHLKEKNQKSYNLLAEFFQSVLYKSFRKNENYEEDSIDFMISDELIIQKFLDDTKKGEDYESLKQYDIHQETLFNVLERTEKKNKKENNFKKGIVQFLNEEDEIELSTNREYQLREK